MVARCDFVCMCDFLEQIVVSIMVFDVIYVPVSVLIMETIAVITRKFMICDQV